MLRANGLKSVVVTNGFLNEEPAREIAPLIDAFNVDLKGIRDEFYREYCGGRVEPVKRFIEIAAAVSHVEVTNLVIPGLNDAPRDFEELADWLAGVSPEIPLHFSRFFPQYRMTDRPATSVEALEIAYAIATKKLRYVYVGNIYIDGTEDTRCPKCGAAIVRRQGYDAQVLAPGGVCPSCGTKVKGVWK
jgi:pyruvate formate lyase activating enzyme